MDMKQVATLGSAGFGATAAALWFYASIVKVDEDPNDLSFKITDTAGGRSVDVLETAKAQTRWNARAAAAASIAATFQVVLLWY